MSNDEIETFKVSIKSIETQLMLIDDSVQALNNYKKQLNQSILEISVIFIFLFLNRALLF